MTSVVDGSPAARPPARVVEARNPSDLEGIVAEVQLATPETFARACRAAREGQPAWAATRLPCAGRRSGTGRTSFARARRRSDRNGPETVFETWASGENPLQISTLRASARQSARQFVRNRVR